MSCWKKNGIAKDWNSTAVVLNMLFKMNYAMYVVYD